MTAVARERRQTLLFLRELRPFAPVFLDTEVDMTGVRVHQADARRRGDRYSTISYVLHAAARVLIGHPDANAAIRGRVFPRIARYPVANGKIALDKTLDGNRAVVSTVLRDLQEATLADIQERIDYFREGDARQQPEFAGVRALQRLPWPLRPLLFRLGVRPLSRRATMFGTFAVSSLGHRAVDGFHAVGGTTVTLGLGRVLDRPVARGSRVVVAPMMRLNLAFDHRVVDGAEAADVLTEIKDSIERFGVNRGETAAAPAVARAR
jgi:pyruvate/2-oxoglutarate dehydrogenase complex dihydrolipoamide acyltransferase (E2) component